MQKADVNLQSTFFTKKYFSGNMLKYIAIVAMLFDHFFAVFVLHDSIEGSILRITGRIVAPIMCYLVAEGYHYTKNFSKYAQRLFLFALIAHFPYVWYFRLPVWQATSVMWGLFLGVVALAVAKKDGLALPLKMAGVAVCCLLAYTADWYFITVLWIVVFGLFYGNFFKQMLWFSIVGVFCYLIPTIYRSGWAHAYEFGIFLAVPLLFLYNGKQGKKNKWIKWGFYIFYPAHLVVLLVLRNIVGV